VSVGGRRVTTAGVSPCQLLKVSLPPRHMSVSIAASAFGSVERRTLQC